MADASARLAPLPHRPARGVGPDPTDADPTNADPTDADMRRYLTVGQRECWRKLPMLATRLRIAHALQALQARDQDVLRISCAQVGHNAAHVFLRVCALRS